jgi:hypothetical protein
MVLRYHYNDISIITILRSGQNYIVITGVLSLQQTQRQVHGRAGAHVSLSAQVPKMTNHTKHT